MGHVDAFLFEQAQGAAAIGAKSAGIDGDMGHRFGRPSQSVRPLYGKIGLSYNAGQHQHIDAGGPSFFEGLGARCEG